LNRKEQQRMEEILHQFSALNHSNFEELKAQATAGLYSEEDLAYETQSIINFYEARIRPYIEKGEKPEDFDKRYREWRIKVCKNCGEEFAYAWSYDGVTHCSLNCQEEALAKIGVVFSRSHDLKKRYGYFSHPAIVPASALATLRTVFSELDPLVFSSNTSPLPIPPIDSSSKHTDDNQIEQDKSSSNMLEIPS